MHLMKKIITLTIPIVIIILAVVTWLYFAKQQTNTKLSNAPAENYLKIKELGIKIPVPQDIKDVVYNYDTAFNAQYPDPQQVTISTQSLNTMSGSSCKASLGVGPLGTIQKTNNPSIRPGIILAPNGTTVFKLEDSYVYIVSPQSSCSTDAAVEALASKQRAAFVEAFKNVQLDK